MYPQGRQHFRKLDFLIAKDFKACFAFVVLPCTSSSCYILF